MSDEMSQPFNKKTCSLSGYEQCWVEFKTSGYTRKFRKNWIATNLPDEIVGLTLKNVTAWRMLDVDGNEIPLSTDPEALDNAEDALVVWLTRTFGDFAFIELVRPQKN